MGDLNMTYERPFMSMICWGCLALGFDYEKLIITSEGVKSYYARTEAPFGNAGYKTTVEQMENLHTESVWS